MVWRILFGVVISAVMLALPANKVHAAVRLAPAGLRPAASSPSLFQRPRARLLVLSSSLVLLAVLVTAAVLRWHPAGLTMLLR